MERSINTEKLDEDQLLNVLDAIKRGDFTRRMSVTGTGTASQISETINTLTDQLKALSSEFNRIAREVGSEGRFGGQAEVEGLEGDWKELLENLNKMAASLTIQVRDFAQTARAAAAGDTSRKATVPAAGETAGLKEALNLLVDRQSLPHG